MSSSLLLAQEARRQRGELLLDQWAEDRLNSVGLTDELVLGTENVSPADRKKLKGIIARLRNDPHPFTQCMKDLRKNQPGWSEDRRKKTCSVLKSLTGRKQGRTNAARGEGACVLLDEGVARLLELADVSVLEEA